MYKCKVTSPYLQDGATDCVTTDPETEGTRGSGPAPHVFTPGPKLKEKPPNGTCIQKHSITLQWEAQKKFINAKNQHPKWQRIGEMEFHSFTQAGVQWQDLGLLQPMPSSFKCSPATDSRVAGITGTRPYAWLHKHNTNIHLACGEASGGFYSWWKAKWEQAHHTRDKKISTKTKV
ncbi:hypothetical protein AAY473_005954 [Plecturocebus cupreus]